MENKSNKKIMVKLFMPVLAVITLLTGCGKSNADKALDTYKKTIKALQNREGQNDATLEKYRKKAQEIYEDDMAIETQEGRITQDSSISKFVKNACDAAVCIDAGMDAYETVQALIGTGRADLDPRDQSKIQENLRKMIKYYKQAKPYWEYAQGSTIENKDLIKYNEQMADIYDSLKFSIQEAYTDCAQYFKMSAEDLEKAIDEGQIITNSDYQTIQEQEQEDLSGQETEQNAENNGDLKSINSRSGCQEFRKCVTQWTDEVAGIKNSTLEGAENKITKTGYEVEANIRGPERVAYAKEQLKERHDEDEQTMYLI